MVLPERCRDDLAELRSVAKLLGRDLHAQLN
jgi:hypothetical protein